MIPIQLRIAGFLSYRDPVELNFEALTLACISGRNGAGKSSLLDAFTWALFGEARGKGGEVINLYQDVNAAEVALTFFYEGNTYRVQRSLPRNKSAILEFQILDGDSWRPLTEKSGRETQARINQTLRLDYETFINASFFLQGKADQFTQKKASERKAVLSSILGLEVWDEYKERTAERRRALENETAEIDGRVAEIDAELEEEDSRRRRLDELEASLKNLASAREAQEAALESVKRNAALLDEQRKNVAEKEAQVRRACEALNALESKMTDKESERAEYSNLLERAAEIEKNYRAWKATRKTLEAFEKQAAEFRGYEEKRQPLLREIEVEKATLNQELRTLEERRATLDEQTRESALWEKELAEAQSALAQAEAKIQTRSELENQRADARERRAALTEENKTLKREMNELKSRIDSLNQADGADCPLCGQPLSESHRAATLADLESMGGEKGDAYRANDKALKDDEAQIAECESQLKTLSSAENERVGASNWVSKLTSKIEDVQKKNDEWKKNGAKRLKAIEKILQSEKFAEESRKALNALDKELTRLGYDVSAHESERRRESELRDVEDDSRKLESAREVSKRIAQEIAELQEEISKKKLECETNESAFDAAAKTLAESETGAPNLRDAEKRLFELRENENAARDEIGGARQRVEALGGQRLRRKELEAQSEEIGRAVVHHKTLERAFGKDGVPALLIEQALPQIQQKANDILERLSDGAMTIQFVTQAEYKNKKRDDLKETLDIRISDSSGMRDYEMYSGGEAFRVNFAIRLALSEILAQRKGARLQTLVIDEGFGSQDAFGRQRLVEAINLIKNDFAKILIITHLDELKDAFPNRIEIEKTERGSSARII